MVSEFTLNEEKFVIMLKEEYDKLLLMASKNEQLTRLFSFYEASQSGEEAILGWAEKNGKK